MSILSKINLLQDNGGSPGDTLTSAQLISGSTFWVEIQLQDSRSAGIVGAGLNLNWDPNVLTANSATVTSSFTFLPSGNISTPGIAKVEGGSIPAANLGKAIGKDKLERFALVQLTTKSNLNATTSLFVITPDITKFSTADGVPILNGSPSIDLVNPISTISENTSTSTAVKVANLSITDDIFGNNTTSLSGLDASSFEIQGNGLYLKAGTPLSYSTKSSYSVIVSVNDTSINKSDSEIFNLLVTVNQTPTITSANTANFAENGTGTAYTILATDPEGTALTYSLSGTDAGLFNINSTTGAVTFQTAPNFETPTDAGSNNVYDITVSASDGSLSASQAVAITVTNVNEAPAITSATTANFAQNGTGTAYTVLATDPDAGTTFTYSLSGTDAGLFNINSTTGAVTFQTAPNFETPTDAGSNNVYDITVSASDGSLSASQAVAITVTNVNEAPAITSATTANFAENGTGTAYTVLATDPDAGTTFTYSLSGTDAGLFNINSTTGAVTFQTAPNFETPTDAGSNNVYDITVSASDGSLSASQAVAITVTDVNEAPTITSATTANFAENGTGTAYTVTATDPDAGTTFTYSLSGTDAGLFNINSTTGAVTFQTAPNFETPTDAGSNNVYDITVSASDGSLSASQAVAITVTDVNEAPTITSATTANFAENGTGTAYTVTATDPDAGTTFTYSLSGTDAGLFNINSTTGAVTFQTAPNFETPTDAGSNNVYDITVSASDGSLSASQAVAITVTDVNEAPTITSATTANFAENGTGTAYTVTATDPDAGTTFTYSLSGTDAGLFNINSTTGAVTFQTAPNFETPTDAGSNNVYDITVSASDGSLSASQAVAITVTDVNEAPTITSATTANFAENGTGTAYTVTATDPEGTALTYSLSGTDAGLFNINSTTGAVTFQTAPNFETPTDAGGNNVYDITVSASDGSLSASQAVAITVTDVNEAPTITSATTANFAENGTGTAYTVTATDPEGTALTYSLSGTDAGLFNINSTTGAVTFQTAPNFETPTDAGSNNVYDITVSASDGSLSASQAVAITVTDVNEAPTITSVNTANFAENGTGTAYTVTATDPEGTALTYSLSGTDTGLFNINSTTGAVTFQTAPNFETPTDAGSNNVYDITVSASDGSLSASQAVAITVTDVNEAPTITSATTANFAENGTGTAYTVTATDPEGTALTYSLSGTDAGLFNINSTTGAVTFQTAPNFETPTDAGSNNVYDITVSASDGSLSASQAVAITVTNVNEAPAITSATTANFAENGTGTAYTVTATDPEGTALTYSLSGTDAGLFNINSTTGAVTFQTAPNFETPTDAGSNNVYDITVSASDGSLSASQAVAITVTDVNEAPAITSATTANFAENGTGTAYTVLATDPDAGTTFTYSLSGTDAGLFNINSTTGVVTFQTAPNFETPTDAGGNNVYDITVSASDGSLSASQAVAITVTNVNEAPAITSANTANFAENGTGTAYTILATDPEGTTFTYSLSGTDAGLFNINSTTGAVTFQTAPNFETPTDTGGNNVYDITVNASDGSLSASQAVAITVTDVNEAPTITSANTANFAENGTGTAYTVLATDPDAGTTFTYSLSGTDAGLFNINSTTGAVTFQTAPNFETPTDTGSNNVYDITVNASDGSLSASQAVAITVTDVNEAPTITSANTANFAENGTGTAYTVLATDPDAGTTFTYSLSGTDAGLFNINSTTGAVTFQTAPNFETPTDAGGNNVYDITVNASDGSLSASQAVAITVTDVNEAPTITSANTANFAENGTGTAYTVTATDPEGTALTYSLSGTDAGLFNINSTTGAVTFQTAPNFETPTDAGSNNVYDITVSASDGSLSASQAVAITVTDVNEAPTITSATTANFAENGTGTAYTILATDPEGTTFTYSLSGTDAGLFNINSTTGAVTFQTAPNFETPTDTGGNNVYDITVNASDGSLSASQAVAITVTDVNEAPTITSANTANFAENGTGTAYTVLATDPDAGTTFTYSLSGTDAGLFNINSTTGAVTFQTAPNFETPTDAGSNNVYDITVSASDGSLSASQAVAITVTNVNEAPAITSATTANFAQNGTGTAYTVLATDPDAGTTFTYSLSGTDAGLFNINSTTGAVTFQTAPNFETPTDAGSNNVYDITVSASDGSLSASQAVAITVTNVNEAPAITSATTANFAENGTGTAYTVLATDPDAGTTFTYSLSGTDAGLFNINSTTGAVTFQTAPNFETPTDAGSNNVYDITVSASDGSLSASQAVAITVTDVNEAPTITSATTANFAENGTGTAYTVTATDPDAGTTFTYSLSGTDAGLFNINSTTGAVTFQTAPNFETPTDTGGNNVYDITVNASDGSLSASQAVAITVTDVNEAPTITSATTANFAENGTGTAYTVLATDPDAGTTFTYSLSGTDAGLFNINSTTGAVTFQTALNFETPTDAGSNNVYDITVSASDGSLSASQAVAITVTNVNEAPAITSATTANFAENGTGTAYTVLATDPDAGTTFTYSLSGTDAGLFNINSTTGAVTFQTAPNFETPTDTGSNNVYDITVNASDGSLSASQAVAITVTDVNEAPTITSANTANFAENGTGTAYTVLATDPDAGTTFTYSLSGTDAGLFNINSTTGAVTFQTAPNFETPTDAGGNNVYDITVNASDGSLSASQAVAITVTDVNEAPTITSANTANFAENGTGTAYTVTATDPEGTALTYSLSGTDAGLFNINSTTGAVTFQTAPNFETPTDAGSNNVYDITVSASDGSLSASQAVAITVTNVNEGPAVPTVTIAATDPYAAEIQTPRFNKGQFTFTLSEAAPVGGIAVNYTVSGTATDGEDYTLLPGTVTIAGGQTTAVVDVLPINDAIIEGNQSVILSLTDGATYDLGATTGATVTIVDGAVGDIDGNGVFTGSDAFLINRFLAERNNPNRNSILETTFARFPSETVGSTNTTGATLANGIEAQLSLFDIDGNSTTSPGDIFLMNQYLLLGSNPNRNQIFQLVASAFGSELNGPNNTGDELNQALSNLIGTNI